MEASEGADGSVQSESEVDSSVDNGFESSGGSEEHVFDRLSSHDEDEASGSIRDVSVAGSDVDDADAEVSDGSDPAIDDEEMALICGECDEKMTELATADEELVCDGDCKRKLAPSEMRYVCTAVAYAPRGTAVAAAAAAAAPAVAVAVTPAEAFIGFIGEAAQPAAASVQASAAFSVRSKALSRLASILMKRL